LRVQVKHICLHHLHVLLQIANTVGLSKKKKVISLTRLLYDM
jgi:hypothetical protein